MSQKDYSDSYSEEGFWKKITTLPNIDNSMYRLVKASLLLYFIMRSSSTPIWMKASIIAALGWLVCPFDLIFDGLFPIGFSDDFLIISTLLFKIQNQITDDIEKKAEDTLKKLFPKVPTHTPN